jgi:hypothetical protein
MLELNGLTRRYGAVTALADSVDSDSVLRAAMVAGRVTGFTFERRRLTEVFRAAMVSRR